MILGGGADHGRTANVDILDDFLARRAFGDSGGEGIKVDDDQVDRTDLMLLHGGDMVWIVAHRQQPAVHLGVQRLDPSVHHFREAGEVGNVLHLQSRLAQSLGRAAGGNQFYPMPAQRLPQFDQAGLVGHGKKGALDDDV